MFKQICIYIYKIKNAHTICQVLQCEVVLKPVIDALMNMEIDPASSSVKLDALVNASLEWIESSGEETKPKPTLLPIAHKGLRAIKLLLDQTPC